MTMTCLSPRGPHLELVRSGKRELGDDAVRQSWSRCVNEYQLHPAKPHYRISSSAPNWKTAVNGAPT